MSMQDLIGAVSAMMSEPAGTPVLPEGVEAGMEVLMQISRDAEAAHQDRAEADSVQAGVLDSVQAEADSVQAEDLSGVPAEGMLVATYKMGRDLNPGDAKAAAKGAKSGGSVMLDLAKLVVRPGFNPRIHNAERQGRVESLCASILREGFYQSRPLAALVEKDGTIVVYDGETRLDAVKLANERGAKISRLPVVLAPEGTNMRDVLVATVKLNEGAPLSPIERAIVCKRMRAWGMSEEEVASEFDISPGYVRDLIRLLAAPQALQDAVSDGKVSAGNAIKTIKSLGAEAAAEVITQAVKDGKKVTPKATKQAAAERDPSKAPPGWEKKSNIKPRPYTLKDHRHLLHQITRDAGFGSLSADLRELITSVLATESKRASSEE